MSPEEMATIAKLCDMLRSKGVAIFEGAGVKIEFGALESDVIDAHPGKTADVDMCRCGHPLYAHMNGGCIEGCEPEKCIDPETLKKAEAEDAHGD